MLWKKIQGNKKGQVSGTSKKRKSETRGKNGQVSDSTIRGTRYPPERKEKENIEHLIPLKKLEVQERYVSPQKSKSRIRLSPLLSLLGILNVITKSRLSSLILITAPKMPNLSLIPLKPSCHPKHDMRDAVLKYAIAHLNK